MPSRKRYKTKYPGVFYVDGTGANGKQTKVYYIIYKKNGRNVEEKAGYADRGMSEAKASALRVEKITGKQPTNNEKRLFEKQSKNEDRITIDKLWGIYKSSKPLSKGRLSADESRYKKYIKECIGDYEPHEVQSKDIANIDNTLKELGRADATRWGVLEVVRRIVNYGVGQNLCRPLVFKMDMPKINNIKTEDLTREELKRLLEAISEDMNPVAGPMMLCALYTGLRRGSMFNLKWSDINFERSFIVLRNLKNGTTDSIPMNRKAEILFKSLPKTSDFVFPGRGGAQRAEIKRYVNRIKRKAKLPKDFRPLHGLRHVFATSLASSGEVELHVLQKLMTHKTPSMTLRYAKLRDEALRRASNVIDKIYKESANF